MSRPRDMGGVPADELLAGIGNRESAADPAAARADGIGEPAAAPLVGISRRDALKTMGAAIPMAGAFTFLTPGLDRAAAFIASLEAQPQQAYVPKYFTADEWRLIRSLVDYIIPRDDRSGSATDARVPEYMDFILMDPVLTSEGNRNAFRTGMEWLDNESRTRFGGRSWIQATDAERRQILDDVAYPRRASPDHAAGVTFFSRARDMTASGFFSSQMGWRDLQYIGNVANPDWNGCPPAANAKLGVTQAVMNTRIPPQR